jgi:phosphoribosylformylglycinamidine synthase
VRVQRLCLEAARRRLLTSAHDCSRGGLAVALAECCTRPPDGQVEGGRGLEARDVSIEGRLDAALFGEGASRIIISTAEGEALESLAREQDVPLLRLGRVGGDRLILGSKIDAAVADLHDAYEEGLPRALGEA